MKFIALLLSLSFAFPVFADEIETRSLVELARETARMTREYADNLSPRERQMVQRRFHAIQDILLDQHEPDLCPPSTYARAFDWARSKGWSPSRSSAFADSVMAQSQCQRYLNTYTSSYEWARRKGWSPSRSVRHAEEFAPLDPRRHECYIEAYDWARSRGWSPSRSNDHARNVCL